MHFIHQLTASGMRKKLCHKLKISVELDRQINLKQFCVIFTFLQTVLVSSKAEFDSN